MHHSKCCADDGFVDQVKEALEVPETLDALGDFFKIFGDATRLKILSALLEGEMCVGTITEVLEMTQSSVSHQLRTLKRARLIKSRKDGKWVYYSINDEHVQIIYKMGLSHIKESD
ncbi:MAG: transcriptional regulator [Firmicutes bacterium HGW-Firmicutes-3]|jgi:ArsR family transcriptional regulator|nr:MAG: transcriptional regulator [Firmicutes bacterium HGW-Firmicutes-3]